MYRYIIYMYKDVFTKRVLFVCCCFVFVYIHVMHVTSIQERYIKSKKYGRGRGGGVTLSNKLQYNGRYFML